jgi:copper(I)-binding protein
MSKKTLYPVLSMLAATTLALTGCGQGTAPTSSASATASIAALTISEPWVKAADSGMSGAFGTIRNNSDKDVTIISVSTPATPMAELHETVMGANGTMQMEAKQGGFVIPANGELKLEPGANHIMLMDLSKPVIAGDEITFELEASDGNKIPFTAQVKDFAGANETYTSGEGSSPTPGSATKESTGPNHSESATRAPSK